MDSLGVNEEKSWLTAFNREAVEGVSLVVLDTCSSTMDISKKILKGFDPSYLIRSEGGYLACFSRKQEKGRGRRTRVWHSLDEGGIYLSLTMLSPLDPFKLNGLSLIVGLGIQRMLLELKVNSNLKWPNDVLIGKKKVSGVLIETVPSTVMTLSNVIIGVGLNVNQIKFDPELAATSLAIELGEQVNYESTAARLLKTLMQIIEEYFAKGFTSFKQEWLNNSSMLGRKVENKELNITGDVVGLDDNGGLLVKVGDEIKCITVGDVGVII